MLCLTIAFDTPFLIFVPRKLISVFMRDQISGNLVNIANYGEEYQKDNESPINVLFHEYGHYDVLETSSDQKIVKRR